MNTVSDPNRTTILRQYRPHCSNIACGLSVAPATTAAPSPRTELLLPPPGVPPVSPLVSSWCPTLVSYPGAPPWCPNLAPHPGVPPWCPSGVPLASHMPINSHKVKILIVPLRTDKQRASLQRQRPGTSSRHRTAPQTILSNKNVEFSFHFFVGQKDAVWTQNPLTMAMHKF